MLLLASCGDGTDAHAVAAVESVGALRTALVPHAGDTPLDERIRIAQRTVGVATDRAAALETLGRLFVAKARRSFDPGFYSLADACARAMEDEAGRSPDATFLRGLVAQAHHRFGAAEQLARAVVDERGSFEDHGLLGDVLLDRGDLRGAGESYQQMLDLKPCLQSYLRAGELEWRRGDVAGARRLFEMARSAGSPRDEEALAWAVCRLGRLELAEGRPAAAQARAVEARRALEDFAPALLLEGRARLAVGDAESALAALERAAALDPLPETRWYLVECLEALGHERADEAREQLLRDGERDDRRTFVQFLLRPERDGGVAPRAADAARGLRLAREELEARADAVTLDSLAWALLCSGELEESRRTAERALATGCPEPRLLLHAAVITRRAGDAARAATLLARAAAKSSALLPSERELLRLESAAD